MKILVLGAAGMIGHRIWLETRKEWKNDVIGLIRKPLSHYENYHIFENNIVDQFDVSEWNKVEKLLDETRPDWIVNAIGITIRKPEMSNLDRALEINSFFPQRLMKWGQANSSRVIHLSTDCVFKGDVGKYTETSQPSAVDNYGKSKFLGEITGDSALTLRFSCIGRELDAHTELLDWFLAQEGGKTKGFRKVFYSGLTTQIIAQEVVKIIRDFPSLIGLFQLSSDPISKYDLLCLIREKFGMEVEISPMDDYVSDKTLICEKYAKATGFNAPSWDQMVGDLKRDTQVKYKLLKRS